MSTVSQIRDEIAARLATISGLRVSALIPEQITPPMAVVSIDRIDYDLALARGADEFTFIVTVVVARPSERSAQSALDGYCNSTGATSVKAAIEADSSLDGAAFDCRVTELRGVAPITIGDQAYLGAEFTITVLAS
jgi:hypothetical protein